MKKATDKIMALADAYANAAFEQGLDRIADTPVPEQRREALLVAIEDALAQSVPQGYKLVPLEPTPEMLAAGGHANSEWLNDNAPIGEARYAMPMPSVYKAMLDTAPRSALCFI